jgi:heme exporter protein A
VPATSSDTGGVSTLTAVDLGCRRGDRSLFRGVNLEVRRGDAVWLRGRNGRGKTSLLRLAAGLSVPESGEVLWGGVPVRRAAGFQDALVYIAHANALKDDLSVTESLQFLARLHRRECDRDAVRTALGELGMQARADAPVRTLSQGQRRRSALARLALEPSNSIWILDEPYDALDAEAIESVNGLLRRHLQRGGSVLLTSHLPPGGGAPVMREFDLDRYS